MNSIETHRSFVNTWECDENDHMNVQFYSKRFGESDAIFSSLIGQELAPPILQHIRYHAELMAGASTFVRSSVVANGDHAGSLVHELIETSGNVVAATMIRPTPEISDSRYHVDGETLAHALPRSVPADKDEPVSEESLAERIASGRAMISYRGRVAPAQCDLQHKMLDQFHIAVFSDAAPHAWDLMGLDNAYLQKRNYGRVGVEMKLSRHQQVEAGRLIHAVTSVEQAREKTFMLRHHVFDTRSGKPLFSGTVTGLMLDLETRKVVAVPEFVRAKF